MTFAFNSIYAQDTAKVNTSKDTISTNLGIPFIDSGDTLFFINADFGIFTPKQRMKVLRDNIREVTDGGKDAKSRAYYALENGIYNVYYGERIVFSLSTSDTVNTNGDINDFAIKVTNSLEYVINNSLEKNSIVTLILRITYILLITAALLGILYLFRRLYPRVYRAIENTKGKYVKSIRIQKFELLNEEKGIQLVLFTFRIIRIVFLFILLYFYFPLVFGVFPETQNISDNLIDYVTSPLKAVWMSFYNFLPNIFYIIVISVLTFYGIKLLRLFFNEVKKGNLTFAGFHTEWIDPTFKLVRFVVMVFAAIVVFPYLPGSDSPAFQGVTIFLGLLISLGSSSAIANIIAGVVLIYMRSFSIGDRVKIAEAVGDVVERNLLVTRLRTVKNVNISIPNAMILGNYIINYSRYAKNHKLILHTSITIGYDVEPELVKSLLIKAADATDDEFVLMQPAPYVNITQLDDYYIHYELNVYTQNPDRMARTYSELHGNIVNEFHKAGVEIMSPAFTAARDGSKIQMPDDYIPKDYEQPPFRIFGLNLFGNK
jgi:small-conductance mechanosensitive channel